MTSVCLESQHLVQEIVQQVRILKQVFFRSTFLSERGGTFAEEWQDYESSYLMNDDFLDNLEALQLAVISRTHLCIVQQFYHLP